MRKKCINCGSVRFTQNSFDNWDCKNPSCMQKFTKKEVEDHIEV